MKFTVTKELSTLLRMLRMQSNISAKELAGHIDRSPSYISKLESGDVKTVQEENLTNILQFLGGGGDFYEEVFPAAVRVLYSFMKPERLVSQVWLMQYDVVERQVTVPEKMADDIRKHLEEQGLSEQELTEVMNANLDSELSSAFLPNEMLSIDYEGKSRLLIRVDYSVSQIRRLLDKKESVVSYFCVYSMVHAMFRMLNFPGETHKLSSEKAVTVLRQAGAYMEQWGVYSLIGFSRMLSSEEFIRQQEPLATAGMVVIDHIAEKFREVAGHDVLLATRQLNAFYDTLDWDAAFAMKLLEIPFAELGGMSFQNKKRLLAELRETVERYDQMSAFEKKLEIY